jgi:hypothetical protein
MNRAINADNDNTMHSCYLSLLNILSFWARLEMARGKARASQRLCELAQILSIKAI